MLDSKYDYIDEMLFERAREQVAVLTAEGRNIDEFDFEERIEVLVKMRDVMIEARKLSEKIAANEAKIAAIEAKIAANDAKHAEWRASVLVGRKRRMDS